MDRDETQFVLPAGVGSCDISDGCDRLGVDAARTGLLRPLWPGCPAVSGRLTTVRLERAERGPSPLAELLDVLAGAAGGMVLVDLGGRVDVQCWGSVLATVAKRAGVRGALVHGAARDVEALHTLGFPTFARGVYPGGMRGRLRLAAVDEPVTLDGQTVLPGSVAVADASGLVVLRAERFEEVAAVAAESRAQEQQQRDAIEAGADPSTLLGEDSEVKR